MKKSILLFILWAAAAFMLTGIYLALMMTGHAVRNPMIGGILFLCVAVMTLPMMALIRVNAKAEKITWLAIVSKILLIFYSISGAMGVLMFILSRLFV